jgi:hypothetical protein
MNKLKVYLCGGIQSAFDSGEGWRKKVTPVLETMNVRVLNPIKLEREDLHHSAAYTQKQLKSFVENNEWSSFDKIMRIIQTRDFKAVRNSDFILCFLDPDVRIGGTVAELEKARDLNIPIFAVCEKELFRENYWILYTIRASGGEIFSSFDKALSVIKERIEHDDL